MANVMDYAREGYVPIGTSSFTSGNGASEESAISQAKRVKADLVLVLNPKYSASVRSQVPITTPTSQTSYTSESATAYGSGGLATAYGNSTTTTYGTQTNFIPITTDRYEYEAIYFIKRNYPLGVNIRELTDGERRLIGSNSGYYVQAVVNGSPAYRNDVLTGDILLAVNGQRPNSERKLRDYVNQNLGNTINLTLYRNNKILQKRVFLGK